MQIKEKLLAVLVLSGIVALSGCTQLPEQDVPTDPQIEAYEEYLQMLNDGLETTAIEQTLTQLLDELDPRYHEPMIFAYEAHLKSFLELPEDRLKIALIDYSHINQFDRYLSDEHQSFFSLLENEYRTMDLNAPGYVTTIPNLLEKAQDVEKHLLAFPQGNTTGRAYELYARYLYKALLGNGIFTELMAADSAQINDEIARSYSGFIEDYPASHTASLVGLYLEILDGSQGDLTSKPVQDFYFNFYTYLRSFLWDNRPPQNPIAPIR
ncbi:MAG: hypothetical protein AVO33_02435 [delta proteobacterium ML8_F1]|nr:MAG: hypothetical protein AVO33_02435 [delta proteobacterium ML8_F1]